MVLTRSGARRAKVLKEVREYKRVPITIRQRVKQTIADHEWQLLTDKDVRSSFFWCVRVFNEFVVERRKETGKAIVNTTFPSTVQRAWQGGVISDDEAAYFLDCFNLACR
jgi:hypothetical protein